MRAIGAGAGQVLELVTFSGDVIGLRRFELPRAALHRYMLIQYLLIAMFVAAMEIRKSDLFVNLAEVVHITLICMAVSVLFLLLMPDVWALIRRRRGGVVRVRVSILTAIASVLGVGTGQLAFDELVGRAPVDLPALLFMMVFFFVLIEVICHYVLLVVMPRVLRELRGEPRVKPRPPEAAVQAGGLPPDGRIVVQGETFDAATLMHVMADGNYVHIRTTGRRAFLPGPFGRVVARLPESLGLQVSRSDWVARSAVVGWRKAGRDLWLDLVDGSEVKVASARHQLVMAELSEGAARGRPSDGAMSIQTG